jgi:hypothetical protein
MGIKLWRRWRVRFKQLQRDLRVLYRTRRERSRFAIDRHELEFRWHEACGLVRRMRASAGA